jgi:hypothetical protein
MQTGRHQDVQAYLDAIGSPTRRRDAETMLELMARASGQPATMWGSIVGFGEYHYRYDSGREGDCQAVGFAARKAATVVYLMDGVGAHAEALQRLGPHTTGVGCLYLKDLGAVDLEVLHDIVATSFRTLTRGTYTKRARDGGRDSD